MSTQDNPTDNTVDNAVNDQQTEEVDYSDPESPTLAIRRLASPPTGQTTRHTDDPDLAEDTDNPLSGIPDDEILKLTWDGTIPNAPEGMLYSPSHPPTKRRRLDLGDLMVKQTGPGLSLIHI